MHRNTSTITGTSTVTSGRGRKLPAALAGLALAAGVSMASAGSAVRAEPTAYAGQRVATERVLAEVAQREGLTGLSPVSLRRIDANTYRVAVERTLAGIAASEGLTGLSPVSLRPISE